MIAFFDLTSPTLLLSTPFNSLNFNNTKTTTLDKNLFKK